MLCPASPAGAPRPPPRGEPKVSRAEDALGRVPTRLAGRGPAVVGASEAETAGGAGAPGRAHRQAWVPRATPSPGQPSPRPPRRHHPGLNRRRRTCTARLRKVPASAASFFTLKSMMFMLGGSRAEPPAVLTGRRGAPRPGWGAGRRRGGRGRWREAAPAPRSCRFLRGRRGRWRGGGKRAGAGERAPRRSHAGPVASPSSCRPPGPRWRREEPTAAPRRCNRGGKQPAEGAWPGVGVGRGVLASTATPAGWLRIRLWVESLLRFSCGQRPLQAG